MLPTVVIILLANLNVAFGGPVILWVNSSLFNPDITVFSFSKFQSCNVNPVILSGSATTVVGIFIAFALKTNTSPVIFFAPCLYVIVNVTAVTLSLASVVVFDDVIV